MRPSILYVTALSGALAMFGCSAGSDSSFDDDAFTPNGNSGPSPSSGGSFSGSPVGTGGSTGITTDDGDPPAPNEGDEYQPVGTNPFVIAAHDPLSTFAADVDTASYDLFRRDVNHGYLPDPGSVRLEEYVNYFAYDYPAPSEPDEAPFRVSVAAAPHLLSVGTTLVRVGVQARKPAAAQKKPANLVFLVDVSGSMDSSDKLPLVRYTLTEALDVLEPTDTVSIVTYASDVSVRLEPTPIAERSTIESAIRDLMAYGSTNGGSGITLAYEQAQAGFIEGGVNHVVLCTDGDFNVGLTSNQDLLQLIRDKRRTGITLTVLGYGTGNLNDSMMEAVSNAGNGIYGVISDEDHASSYVTNRLLSTIEHVAKDVKIQVEFNPNHVYAYRLLGYENRALADQDFDNDVVDAGEVGAGHRVTALYELVPAGGELPQADGAPAPIQGSAFAGTSEVAADDLVLVKLRYKAVGATETDPALEVNATLSPDAVAPNFSAADLDLQFAMAIATYAEILKASPYARPDALEIIGNIAAAQATRDSDRAEFLQLFRSAEPLLRAR